jgi:hypothetical protein
MEDADRAYDPAAGGTPAEAFDKEWNAALLRTVRANLAALYAATSDPAKRQAFEIFSASQFPERHEDHPTQEALAQRFGISRDQVRYALAQVRKRWERLLRQEIRDQVGADVEVEEEIRKLL